MGNFILKAICGKDIKETVEIPGAEIERDNHYLFLVSSYLEIWKKILQRVYTRKQYRFDPPLEALKAHP